MIDIYSKTEKEKIFEEYTDQQWNEVLKPESILSPHHHVTYDTPTRPKIVTYSSNMFQKAIGFRNVHKVLAKMKQVSQPTLKINDLSQDLMQDPGEMATMKKQLCNTTPLQFPE